MTQVARQDHSTLFAVIIGVLLGLALWLLWFNNIEPFYSFLNPIVAWSISIMASLGVFARSLLAAIGKYAQENPIPATLEFLSVAGAGYGILSKLSADRAKNAVQNELNAKLMDAQSSLIDVSQKHDLAQQQIQTLNSQLDQYKNDDYVTQLETNVSQLKGQLTTQLAAKDETIRTLENMIQDMKQKTVTLVQ
jgi:hypothetical protein